jgi:hypothetical protein
MSTIRLRGVGHVPAIRAAELRPGMVTVFNEGRRFIVLSIERADRGQLLAIFQSPRSMQTFSRRLKPSKLVGIVPEVETPKDVLTEALA